VRGRLTAAVLGPRRNCLSSLAEARRVDPEAGNLRAGVPMPAYP
jgi:hypothetical protein